MLSPVTVLVMFSLPALALLACVKRIPEGQAYTLRRVGGHIRAIGAGTHVVVPLVERVAHRMRLLGNIVSFHGLAAAGQVLNSAIYYQILDADRADAVIDGIDNQKHNNHTKQHKHTPNNDNTKHNRRLK